MVISIELNQRNIHKILKFFYKDFFWHALDVFSEILDFELIVSQPVIPVPRPVYERHECTEAYLFSDILWIACKMVETSSDKLFLSFWLSWK